MHPTRNALLSQKAQRKLRPIRAEGSPPSAELPLASFIVAGDAPPRVSTSINPVRTGRSRGWQVTVRSHDTLERVVEPPKFVHTRFRRPGRIGKSALLVSEAYRPRWVAFDPDPRLVRRPGFDYIVHKGKRLTPFHRQGEFDNRRTYNDTSYPWGCVCNVISGSKTGSGVLIGPRHVLTASHVIDWAAGWAMVEVHRFDATFVAGSCCTRLNAFTKMSSTSPSTVDEDYAVLTVAERLGDRFGWMGAMTYDSGYDGEPIFRTIGYAGDLASATRPVYERDFHLDEDEFDLGEARVMTCGADFEKGQSGSPIFAFAKKDDLPYVVAVCSAGGDDGNNYCAGGSWLTKLVRESRQLDP